MWCGLGLVPSACPETSDAHVEPVLLHLLLPLSFLSCFPGTSRSQERGALTTLGDGRGRMSCEGGATWPCVLTLQLDSCTRCLGGRPAAAGPPGPGHGPSSFLGVFSEPFWWEGGTVTLLESEPHVGEWLEGFPCPPLEDVLPWLLGLLIPWELPPTPHSQWPPCSSCRALSMCVHRYSARPAFLLRERGGWEV